MNDNNIVYNVEKNVQCIGKPGATGDTKAYKPIDNVFTDGNSKNDENNDNEINQKSDLKKSILDKIK